MELKKVYEKRSCFTLNHLPLIQLIPATLFTYRSIDSSVTLHATLRIEWIINRSIDVGRASHIHCHGCNYQLFKSFQTNQLNNSLPKHLHVSGPNFRSDKAAACVEGDWRDASILIQKSKINLSEINIRKMHNRDNCICTTYSAQSSLGNSFNMNTWQTWQIAVNFPKVQLLSDNNNFDYYVCIVCLFSGELSSNRKCNKKTN